MSKLAVFFILLCPALLVSAQDQPRDTPPASGSLVLHFGEPKTVLFRKKPAKMLGNFSCAEDGDIFLPISDSMEDLSYTLHALSGEKEIARFDSPVLKGFSNISFPLHSFVSDQEVAILVSAENERVPGDKSEPITSFLVLIYDRKGNFKSYVPLPKGITVRAVGLFSSGEVLLVGLDQVRHTTRLVVLDLSGSVQKELSLFDEDYNSRKDSKERQPLSALAGDDGALLLAELLPYGQNLLLFPRTTQHSVLEISKSGIVRSTALHLPPKVILGRMLSASPKAWKVQTSHMTEIVVNEKTGDRGSFLPDGSVLEFDPSEGTVRQEIVKPKGAKAMLICEHDGDYLAIRFDQSSQTLQILSGRAER